MEFIGLGVAGNIHQHLEQVGEASNFATTHSRSKAHPKGLFPWYTPNAISGTTGINPLSSDTLYIMPGADIHPEPEVALYCNVTYSSDGQVQTLQPTRFTAFNDASIRNSQEQIPQKKNWGEKTKGISSDAKEIDSFTKEGVIGSYSLVSWLKRANTWERFSDVCAVDEYMLFFEPLMAWLITQCNHQKNDPPLENLQEHFKRAGFPSKAIVGCGATRYTNFGERTYLQDGDTYVIALFNHTKTSVTELETKLFENVLYSNDDITLLRQHVVMS